MRARSRANRAIRPSIADLTVGPSCTYGGDPARVFLWAHFVTASRVTARPVTLNGDP